MLIDSPPRRPSSMKKKYNKCGREQNVTTDAKRTICSICDAKIPLRVLIASLLLIGAVDGSTYPDITAVSENLIYPLHLSQSGITVISISFLTTSVSMISTSDVLYF